MGMVTLHLVIGVGVFLVPLFLLLFSTLAIPEFKFLYGKLFAPHTAMEELLLLLDHSPGNFCVPSFSSHERVNVAPIWNLAIKE